MIVVSTSALELRTCLRIDPAAQPHSRAAAQPPLDTVTALIDARRSAQTEVMLATTVQFCHLAHALGATFLMGDLHTQLDTAAHRANLPACAAGDRCASAFYRGFLAVRPLPAVPALFVKWVSTVVAPLPALSMLCMRRSVRVAHCLST